MFNPVFILILTVCFIAYGPRFFLYLGTTWMLSCLIGWYAETRILAYDRAIRRRAKSLTGRDMPGSACELAHMVRVACKWSGPFTVMTVPAAILVLAWFYSYRTWQVNEGTLFHAGTDFSTREVEEELRRCGGPRPGLPAPRPRPGLPVPPDTVPAPVPVPVPAAGMTDDVVVTAMTY